MAGSGQAGSVPRGSGGRSADGGGLFVLSEPDAAGRMAGAGDVLSWVLCAMVLLSVTGPVLSVRSGGFLKFLGGRRGGGHFSYHRGHSGHHGGHSSHHGGHSGDHKCRFDWNAAKTIRFGSSGFRRFIAAKVSSAQKYASRRATYHFL